MKKIAILSVPGISIILCFLFMGVETQAQENQKVKQTLTEINSNFVDWFNTGQIDSIGLMYLDNACMIPDSHREIHGRENIKGYYSFLYASGFRFTETNSKSIIISDSIAVERGVWKADLNNKMTGTYLTQWRLSDSKWYIENEMTNTDSDF